MTTFKVLSIDAWSDTVDGDISWSWNNWFNFDSYDENEHGELNESNALKYYSLQLSDATKISEYEIDDDQYNLILVRRFDQCPILAIEYGSKIL